MKRQHHHTQAFSLVECLVVMLVLMIAFTGMIGFRYHSVICAERAEAELLAARAAVAISEAWRAQKGANDFDPTQQSFAGYFEITSDNSMGFYGINGSGAMHLGKYQVSIEGREFTANLTYEDSSDVPGARHLHVVMTWQDRKQITQRFRLSTLTRT